MDGDDVEEGGEVPADPGAGVVLVRDGVDAELPHESGHFILSTLLLDLVESLGEDIGTTPSENPERLLGCVSGGDQGGRGVARGRLLQSRQAVDRVADDDLCCDLLGSGIDTGLGDVGVEVIADVAEAANDAEDGGGVDRVVLPDGSDSGDVDDVQLVRVSQEADQTHLVVGFVGDVGHDEGARLVLEADIFALAGLERGLSDAGTKAQQAR